jgi:RNA recognition motif-containing protein
MDSNNWRVKRDPSEAPAASTPNRSFNQRRSNGFGDARDSLRSTGISDQQRSSPTGRSSFQSRDARRPLSDPQAEKAIDEGRRLYVGNLPYDASVQDIESLFKDVSGIEAINMSVDPMTGRNPSYCFVDLESKLLAEKVIEEFNGRHFRQRPLKVKPGVKSGSGTGRFDVRSRDRQSNGEDFAFDRWRRLEKPEELDVAVKEGRRVYVGGLPRFKDQADTNSQIRELFAGYTVEVVSKLISAHESKKDEIGNHNYCFVDLATADEAAQAIGALDGLSKWNWDIKVRQASGSSGKLRERRRLFVGGLPEFTDQQTTETRMRELFGGFQVTVTSRLFLPRDEAKKSQEGNHCFCFVELGSEEETDRALATLDWKEMWDSVVRVKPANSSGKGTTDKPAPRGWGFSRD